MSTMFGRKLRLNIVALISEASVGRLLVCIDDESLVEDLNSKVRGALARSQIEGRLLRLTNSFGANLPNDEKVGDVVRDAEEVLAVLTKEPEDPFVCQQLAGGVGEIMSFSPRQNGMAISSFSRQQPRENFVPPGEESFSTALPQSSRRMLGPAENMQGNAMQPYGIAHPSLSPRLPGPAEIFEEDLLDQPAAKDDVIAMRNKLPTGSDWCVEGLTPKLREYISTRFREANISLDPGNTFIAVTMQPRARAGAVPSQPIHYSIARIDIVEFERLCGLKTQETRARADHFRRCQMALTSMLDHGSLGSQYAPNMLPYRFRDGEEFSGLLQEADTSDFGAVEGFRPTILIDNSGATGENLVFLRSALKRILYSFLVAKSKFNLLKFSPQGNPVAWANGMVPPTSQVLREAEEFLDCIQPVKSNHSAKLLEGVQMALSHPEADVVYVLTSGLPRRCSFEVAVRSLRSMNIRDLPLHILGVECGPKAELELRRLAEDNHGSFRHKRFGPSNTGGGREMTAAMASLSAHENDDARLTISGQMSILEIMLDEQERHTVDWLEEQKCANRLLLTTMSQQAVPDVDDARRIYQRSAINEVNKQCATAHSHLQELVDMHIGKAPAHYSNAAYLLPSPADAAGYSGPGAERRRVAARDGRSASVPRGGGAAAAEAMRRPSTVNPWDRPGATVKVSQMVGKKSRGAATEGRGPLAPRAGRPNSARGRPNSASARRQVY